MKIYVCFHVSNNEKKIYLVFADKEKMDRFMSKHPECYMEEWEAID